jgi:hypothetical protein
MRRVRRVLDGCVRLMGLGVNYATTGFLTNFKGKNIASAAAYGGVAASVKATAGYGHI